MMSTTPMKQMTVSDRLILLKGFYVGEWLL